MNFCPFCGQKILPDAKFCMSCGASVSSQAAPTPCYTQPAVAEADNNAPEVNRFNTPALMGMIFGTVSITSATLGLFFSDLLFWVMAFIGIPAVILGIIGLTKPGYKPMSIVGVITGTLGSLYPALFIIILFTLLFGKSNVAIVSDTLIDNNYVYVENDELKFNMVIFSNSQYHKLNSLFNYHKDINEVKKERDRIIEELEQRVKEMLPTYLIDDSYFLASGLSLGSLS